MPAFSSSSSSPFQHLHNFVLPNTCTPFILNHSCDPTNANSELYQTEHLHINIVHQIGMDSSSVFAFRDKHEFSQKVDDNPPMDKNRKPQQGSSYKKSSDLKGKKRKIKLDEKKKSEKGKKVRTERGYIPVRARRGQATDNHSLAERLRRERISERMKVLQALVPGCEKVVGKALVLDEIINYVQFLQNQVEFLSMKLAWLNPMFYDFGVDLESLMLGPHQGLTATRANLQYDHLLENIAFIPIDDQGSRRHSLWEGNA